MHGYFGLCLSLIHEGTLRTRLVACRRMASPHTAENITKMYSELTDEFDIAGKIRGIVTDNASSKVKAFKQKQIEETGDDDDDDFMRCSVDWNELQGQDDFEAVIPSRYSCLAHTLQLEVKDGLREATSRIQNLIHKCSSFVSSIHKSCKATEMLEDNDVPHIPTQNATRWNSTFSMLGGVINAENKSEGILKKISILISSSVVITPKDIEVLKEIGDVLAPFANATTILEADFQPTSGLVIPTLLA